MDSYFTKLVLSGGAIKGLVYLGVIEYLEKFDLLKNFDEIVGCSIGALIGLLITLGYSSVSLKTIIAKTDLDSLKNVKYLDFMDTYGLDTGEKINLFIQAFLKTKGIDPMITLIDLYSITKINLITVTTDVNNKKTVFMSKETFPDIPVYLAVRMSMNVPLIYSPIKYKEVYYVDGGVSCNYPIRYYSKNGSVFGVSKDTFQEVPETRKVLGVNLKGTPNLKIRNLKEYLINLVKCASHVTEDLEVSRSSVSTISINVDISFTDNLKFDLPENKKKELYLIGYNSFKKFYEDNML